MKRITLFVLTLLILLSIGLTACAGQATEAPDPTEPMEAEIPDLGTIKVGYIPILGMVPLFVAQEKGYFEEQGLQVETESFRTGGDMIAPLSLGQLDVGSGETGVALMNAVDQDLDVQVVMGFAQQKEGHAAVPLVVRTELCESGEISSVSDLEGRKVALNAPRGMAEYLLAEALEQADLTVDDVEVTHLPFPEVPQALANGAVDAAILPHPLASSALRPGENDAPPIACVLLEGDDIAENPQNGAVYFGKRFLDPENREIAVRFLAALIKGVRDIQGDAWRTDDEIVNAILVYVTVPEPAVRNGINYYFDPNGVLNTSSTEDILRYHFERGYTELDAPLPLSEIFDESFLQEALELAGEY